MELIPSGSLISTVLPLTSNITQKENPNTNGKNAIHCITCISLFNISTVRLITHLVF